MMKFDQFAGAGWLRQRFGVKPSPLGELVADILGQVYEGIYHLPESTLCRVNWTEEHNITLCVYGSLASYDGWELTHLVILCHDACIRLEIEAAAHKYLRLWFSARRPDGVNSMRRHPSIEQAIERTRRPFYAAGAVA